MTRKGCGGHQGKLPSRILLPLGHPGPERWESADLEGPQLPYLSHSSRMARLRECLSAEKAPSASHRSRSSVRPCTATSLCREGSFRTLGTHTARGPPGAAERTAGAWAQVSLTNHLVACDLSQSLCKRDSASSHEVLSLLSCGRHPGPHWTELRPHRQPTVPQSGPGTLVWLPALPRAPDLEMHLVACDPETRTPSTLPPRGNAHSH